MRMTERLTYERIEINWIIWMNARKVKNDCVKMKRNIGRNVDQMNFKKRIILTKVNATIGELLIVRLWKKILKTRKKWMAKEEVELTGRWKVEEGMMKIKGTCLKI